MTDNDDAPLSDLDRYLLEARAAHVYLDAAESLGDAAHRARNIARARDVLAEFDRSLRAWPADHPARDRLQTLRNHLNDRLQSRG